MPHWSPDLEGTMTQPGPSSQHAATATRRPHISSGTIPQPPPRQTTSASSQQQNQPTSRSRTRSRTGSLPPRSRERNAQHLPEVPPFPHPDDEDPTDTPHQPPAADAAAGLGNENPVVNIQGVERSEVIQTCTEVQRPLNDQLNQLSQPGGRLERLESALQEQQGHRVDTKQATANAEAIAKLADRLRLIEQVDRQSDQAAYQDRLLEDLRTLRTDVNLLLEQRSGNTKLTEEIVPVRTVPHVGKDQRVNLGPVPEHPVPVTNTTVQPLRVSNVDRDESVQLGHQSRSARNSRRSHGSSRRDSRRTSFQVKHDDSTETETDESNDSQPNEGSFALDIHQRRKGPKQPGLNSLVPSDERFDRLMSYRFYRLLNTTATRTQDSTTRLHRTLKNLELTMKENKFTGEDPILIFDFLSRTVEEADTLAMNEGQLVTCLPHLLTKTAAQQYRSIASRSRSGTLTKWPEAVQYLLRTYATDRAIQEAVEALENIRQASNEDENAYASRVGTAAYRCGNVHTESEKITIFVHGLQPATRSIVSRFRRDQPRSMLTFDRVVSFARDEGDAYRARVRQPRSGTPPPPSRASPRHTSTVKPATDRSVHFLDPSQTPSLATGSQYQGDAILLADYNDGQLSAATADLPSTIGEEVDQDAALAIIERQKGGGRPPSPRVRPHPIPHAPRPPPGWKTDRPTPICHKCYDHGHYSPDCRVSIADFELIAKNYQSLSADDKARVPDKNYLLARKLVDSSQVPDPAPTKTTEDPKN